MAVHEIKEEAGKGCAEFERIVVFLEDESAKGRRCFRCSKLVRCRKLFDELASRALLLKQDAEEFVEAIAGDGNGESFLGKQSNRRNRRASLPKDR